MGGARTPPIDRGYARPVTPGLHLPGRQTALCVVLLGSLLAGCAAAATFDPAGPCDADGKAPGAYPDLEGLLPDLFDGRAPDRRDSGRSCTDAALGSLGSHEVAELRFAGATWDFGNGRAVTMAVLSLPNRALPVVWAEEFYELGARNGRRTEHVQVSRPTFDGGGPVFRLNTLNDLSFQTVVVWADGDRAGVVLVASPVNLDAERAEHDAVVAAAFNAAVGFVGGD